MESIRPPAAIVFDAGSVLLSPRLCSESIRAFAPGIEEEPLFVGHFGLHRVIRSVVPVP